MPVQIISERRSDGSPIPSCDDEKIALTEANCRLSVESDGQQGTAQAAPDIRSGTLVLTNKRLVWLDDEDTTLGFGVDYQSIGLHALTRDPAAFPFPCIYCQIDGRRFLRSIFSLPPALDDNGGAEGPRLTGIMGFNDVNDTESQRETTANSDDTASASTITTTTITGGGDGFVRGQGPGGGGSDSVRVGDIILGPAATSETTTGAERVDGADDDDVFADFTVDVGIEQPGEIRVIPRIENLEKIFKTMTDMAALCPDEDDDDDDGTDVTNMMQMMMQSQLGETLWQPDGAAEDAAYNQEGDLDEC